MSTYTPDKWIIVEVTHKDEKTKKVFANWYGGYTGSDSWKLSSGITETIEFEDRYEYTNYSGSLYICYKGREGTTGYGASVLSTLEKDLKELGGNTTTLEVVKDE